MHEEIIEILKRADLDDERRIEELLLLFRPPSLPRSEADLALIEQAEELLERSLDDCPADPVPFEKTPIYQLVTALAEIPETEAKVSCVFTSIIALRLAQVARNAGFQDAQSARLR